MPMPSGEEMLSQLKAGAREHGDQHGDMDYEVGDLHDVLYFCWEVMTNEQKLDVYAKSSDVLAWLDPDDEEVP